MAKKITSLVNALVKVLEFLTGIFALIMMIALFWQVVTRFVFKVPSIWTEELARYSFIYMAMLGAAVGVRKGNHFGMTMITDNFTGKLRNLHMKYVVNGVILLCSTMIVLYGVKFSVAYGLTRVSPTFLIPMIWAYIAIPIAGIFMILFSMYNMIYVDYSHVVSLEEELGIVDPDLNNSKNCGV